VVKTSRAIQGLVLFSTALGVFFLRLAYPLLPPLGFDFVAAGWVLFAIDSVLTFLKPRISYYLAFVLAILALSQSLGQSAHYSLLLDGDLAASAVLVLGSAAQVLLLILIPLHFIGVRKNKEWAWPGAESQD
jgi:hypothetical protein